MVPESSRENKSSVASDRTGNTSSVWEQKEETALRQSEAFLRSIYTGTGIAIYLVDVTTGGDFVNAL